MAKSKTILPKKWIEVSQIKNPAIRKNQWYWVKRSRNKPKNAVYQAIGFDTRKAAKLAAKRHNADLKEPVPVLDTTNGQWSGFVPKKK